MYLEVVVNFYSGCFDEVEQGFKVLQDVLQFWLKEIVLYLQVCILFNVVQQNVFDDMGFFELQNVDKVCLEQICSVFEVYLQVYLKGFYVVLVKGL